jgi:hypothetical protein
MALNLQPFIFRQNDWGVGSAMVRGQNTLAPVMRRPIKSAAFKSFTIV